MSQVEDELRAALKEQLSALHKLQSARAEFDKGVQAWGARVNQLLEAARGERIDIGRVYHEVEAELERTGSCS